MLRSASYLPILLLLAACGGGDDDPMTPPDSPDAAADAAGPGGPDAAGPGGPDAAGPGGPDAAVGSPTISDQQVATAEDTPVEISLDATDPDGDPLTFTVGGAQNGGVTGTPPALSYTPDFNFHGTDTFTVEASDGVLTATATITVTVAPVNDAPVAASNTVGVLTGNPLQIELIATDVDGDSLTFTIVDQPDSGALSGNGAVRTYTPGASFSGQDSFTFRARDGALTSNTATVTIIVVGPGCGNGTVTPPEQCDDDNNQDGDGCSALCVIERCGDGRVNNSGSEVCDDGNTTAGDGCRADCRGREECGDGLTDTGVGEQCDDDNTSDGDGCDSECRLENPFVSVPAQAVSGALSCATAYSNTGRKAAVDQLGRFYVVMNCSGEAYVVTSADRGATWSAPVSTGATGMLELAIEGGAPGIAYVAGITSSGSLVFTRTTDGGGSWQSPVGLSGVAKPDLSMDAFEDSVFIAVSIGPNNLRILRNTSRGEGTFQTTDLAQDNQFHDVIVDKVSGQVVAVSDTPVFHVRVSSDQGVTFGEESRPAGEAFVSDWIGSNGLLYVVGVASPEGSGGTDVDVIPLNAPGTSSQVDGLPQILGGAPTRAIDADALGNAYVVSGLSDGNVQLDRMRLGASAINPADVRTIGAGSIPAVAALPSNNGALIAYTSGTTVYAAVVVY
jgi:cysteine-rich repeat protein